MLFYSFEFMYMFLPVAVIGYFITGHIKRNLAVKWVVLCSLFFYGWWNPAYVIFLAGSVLFNYYSGLVLGDVKNKWLLGLTICVNLGFLGYFKYAGFFASIAADLTGRSFQLGDIVLPLGISFFTFQQIAWLVDNFSGKISNIDRGGGIWTYGQFVTFFPQLIAGPIVHHSEMMPQFHDDKNKSVNWNNIAAGISFFVIGLTKKVVIADLAAPYANIAFDIVKSGETLSFMGAWIGALAYTIQIYFDFSGYADMAIGLALMFNIRLPLNFNSPYKSQSISEFWRRWHMTLGRFLRQYVYFPMGGSYCGQFKLLYNLFFTFFICGIWHGAGWTFILWGVVHGGYIIIDRLWHRFSPIQIPQFLSIGLTFVCVVFGWVLFRAESVKDAWVIIKTMLTLLPADSLFIIQNQDLTQGLYLIVPMLLIILFFPNSQECMGSALRANKSEVTEYKQWKLRFVWKTNTYWTTYMIILGFLSLYCIIDQSMVQEFIYFQF